MKIISSTYYKYFYLLIIVLTYIYISYNNNKNFMCLCVIAKEENLYAKEYVNHYKNLGYNHIFIYDNNDLYGEKFENVIEDEIKSGFVSILNYRGYHLVQVEAYYDCYEKNKKKYQWLSFFDFDEFLEIKTPDANIQKFLDKEKFHNCLNIKVNWVFFNDNNSVFYDKKPLNERFMSSDYDKGGNKNIKSIVRGNLNVNYWKNAPDPHSSKFGFYSCSPSGKRILNTSPFNFPPDLKGLILRHYHSKSIEEYIWKIKRGRPDIREDKTESYFKFKLNQFFNENNKTKLKLEIIKKYLNITMN